MAAYVPFVRVHFSAGEAIESSRLEELVETYFASCLQTGSCAA